MAGVLTAGRNGRPRVAPSRPRVAIGGTESRSLMEGLVGLRIHETADGLFGCEATFGNWGTKDNQTTFLYFDRHLLDFGRELAVGLGDGDLFHGRITGLEAQFPRGSRRASPCWPRTAMRTCGWSGGRGRSPTSPTPTCSGRWRPTTG